MKRACAVLASFLCLTSAAVAQLGGPPAFKTVVSVDKEKGQIIFLDTVVKLVPVHIEMAVVKDGKTLTERRTEYVMEYHQRMVVHDAAKSRVITPDGKQLPIDEVWKRLKANTVVVVSAEYP